MNATTRFMSGFGIALASICVAMGTAIASPSASLPNASGTTGQIASCSDPRLMVRFSTAQQAYGYCSQYASEYYDVGTTYDHGYGQYTCSCYWKGQQGGR